MPKKIKEKKRSSCRDDGEYVKAAAWAWYQHGGGSPSKLFSESDAQNKQKPASTISRPSRFKLEATRLANLKSNSSSLHTVRKRAKSLHGLDRSKVGGCQMFESHEDQDLVDSSLLDYYEIVDLSRHLEKRLSISVKKSAVHSQSLSADFNPKFDVGIADNSHSQSLSANLNPKFDVGAAHNKKKVSKASKSGIAKRWLTPTMCSVTDVVIPRMGEIGSPKSSPSRSNSKKKRDLSFHGVKQRLQQALVLSPLKRLSHGNDNIRASSGRRNSMDSTPKRQTCDAGSS